MPARGKMQRIFMTIGRPKMSAMTPSNETPTEPIPTPKPRTRPEANPILFGSSFCPKTTVIENVEIKNVPKIKANIGTQKLFK